MLESFLKFLKFEKRYSENTVIAYQNDIQQFIRYLKLQYEITNLELIQHAMVRSWMVHLVESGLSNRSIGRKLSSLQTFFKYLLRTKKIQFNPAKKIILPKVGKRLPDYLQENQINQLLDGSVFNEDYLGLRDRLIIEMLYQTGMRRSELIGLKKSDIDLDRMAIKVLGKGNKERIIPLSDTLRRIVNKYLEKIPEDWSLNPYLILTDKGKPLYPKIVYNVVKKYLSFVSSMDKKSPHVLRHTFATHLSNQGAELNAIKELLGHANLSATQIYTHNSIEKLKQIYQSAHPKS